MDAGRKGLWLAGNDKTSYYERRRRDVVSASLLVRYRNGWGHMSIDAKRALSIVFSAADAYGSNLANRMLLFMGVDGQHRLSYIETRFDESNFKHLTGLKTSLSPKQFFDMCCKRRLSAHDFRFADNGTTQLKLEVLPRVVASDLSARMMGDSNKLGQVIFADALVGGTSACIGFQEVGAHKVYVPKTLLKEDVRKLTKHKAKKIVLTCRKGLTDARYSEIVYIARNENWSNLALPEGFAYLEPLIRQHLSAAS